MFPLQIQVVHHSQLLGGMAILVTALWVLVAYSVRSAFSGILQR
jgi:hypothetical protein